MNPLVDGAFAPVQNAASERQCVKGRINDLRKPEPKSTPFVTQCMIDFVEQVVGSIVLEPVDVETVIDKQTGAGQKLSLSKAMVAGDYFSRMLKCFIKSEAYGDVKDPRNISQYNDKDKLTMARFALALSAHLKQFPWYGPGKTPLQVAKRVAEISLTATMLNVSDYHRMDGTISYLLRQVDRMVFMKAFIHHRAELNELLKRNCDNVGKLPNGTTFDQGPSHGSGCSATSTSQTLRAAFTAYLGFRNATAPSGERYTSVEAFEALGIHLGDDGLDANLPIPCHEWAAKRVGLVLEAGLVQRGCRGVTFLARYYSPDVWNGRLDSMCDVKRQLSKFHTTVRLPTGVKAESKLVEKALGYVATDGNTPVIGELCKRAVSLSPHGETRRELGISTWWSKFETSEQFPNTNGDGWMDAEFSVQFPEFDRSMFNTWFSTLGSLSNCLSPPLCAEPKPATATGVDTVVDGDVLPAKETSSSPPIPEVPEVKEAKEASKRTTRTDGRKPKPKRDPPSELPGAKLGGARGLHSGAVTKRDPKVKSLHSGKREAAPNH
jgi:hypothetical protein